MFLRPIVKTEERVSFGDIGLLGLVDLCQEYYHSKLGLPYNLVIDLDENGYTISYPGWDTLILTKKYCFLNDKSGDGTPDTYGILWIRSMMRLQLILHLRIYQ